MIRDPGPIHNLGNGLTSRDVPLEEGETEGMSPNSGIVARALDEHPVMRFFAHTGTSLLVAGVLGAMTKSGGLRLAKTLQSRSDSGGKYSTRLVKSILDIRRELDELQGVTRKIDGVDDAYSRIVFERSGKLTTGYNARLGETAGYKFLTQDDIDQAQRGFMSEPTAVWAWRDQLQHNLVRAGRRLPYELPALYVAQRGVTDTLFGENQNNNVNWYNPVDVIADFTKQSVYNIATAILPFEFAGAGLSSARNSLHSLRYTYNDMDALTGGKRLIAQHFPSIETVLNEVGHDFANLTDKILKKSAQSSGALSAASEAFQDKKGFTQALHSMRNSFKDDYRQAVNNTGKRHQAVFNSASKIFYANTDDTSIFDLFPGFRGITKAFKAGKQEFTLIGHGYDAHKSALAFNETLHKLTTSSPMPAQKLLEQVQKVQTMHNSRLSRVADHMAILGRGGPSSAGFTRSDFYRGQMQKEAKNLLTNELNAKLGNTGVSFDDINNFVKTLDVHMGRYPGRHSTNTTTIGKSRILGLDESNPSAYFDEILQRYRQDKVGQELFEKIAGSKTQPGSVLEDAINSAKQIFTSKAYQASLKTKIGSQWNSMIDDLASTGSAFMKPKKGQYQDYIGPLTAARKNFLEKKSAELLGIPLVGEHGREISETLLKRGLAARGFDPNSNLYYQDLRGFLIRNKQIDSGIFSKGYNIFGLQSLSVDEARDRGFFQFMPEDRKETIYGLARRMVINDPIEKSIAESALDGVYKTRSGQTIDVSALKSTFASMGDFFASQFKIPILGFNPADLFGYRSFKEMAQKSPLQYVPGMSVQPFRGFSNDRSDFYIWQSTGGFKGTKGTVTSYSTSEAGQVFGSEVLPGTYRPVPTKSSDMISRVARFAAGFRGASVDEIAQDISAGQTGRNKFLTKVLGNESRAIRFKRAMSIDSEQPNSLINLATRFASRRTDINNPLVLQRLLKGETVQHKVRGQTKTMTMQQAADGKLQIVDEAGQVISGLGEEQIIRAFHSMRGEIENSFFSRQVIAQLEKNNKGAFGLRESLLPDDAVDAGLGGITSLTQLEEVAERIVRGRRLQLDNIRSVGGDPSYAAGTIANIERELYSTTTSTIVSRQDRLRNLIFQYAIQDNAAAGFLSVVSGKSVTGTFADKFVSMNRILDDLVSTGAINKAQSAEAQAAGLYTFFNMNAFATYSAGSSSAVNERSAVAKILSTMRTNDQVHGIFNVIDSGQFGAQGGPFRSKFNFMMPALKRRFGTAPYQQSPLSLDPLGTGQDVTFVPTFGTVFGQDRFGAIKSAIGLTTYNDPLSFSGAGVPIAQGVERLNRYFGTLGMQLDVNSFSGPLGLFAQGMTGKRVLPFYAAGLGFMTFDRTLGGLVAGEDMRGENIYSPLILGTLGRGVVEAQALGAGIIPGGMGYEEKREQLLEGEVPIRRGRFWPLSNTPFKGGEIMYYSPSWYRRLQGAANYTSETMGSPIENMLYYTDISPLRPFDPYRFERKHYETRPYPVSGDYFTGPFGPMVPLANATIGRLLKPRISMHEEAVQAGLAGYAPAGFAGAYNTAGYIDAANRAQMSGGQYPAGGAGAGSGMSLMPSSPSSVAVGTQISSSNARMAASAGPLNTASNLTASSIASFNQNYRDLAYGPPRQPGMTTPEIIPTGAPINPGSLSYMAGDLMYRTQEMLGIYGFGFGTLRESLGYGSADVSPDRSVLQSASAGYSSTKSFWDMHLGGLGDFPLAIEGPLGNVEFSEIVRRFIPRERTDIEQINPIPNTMGTLYPFLPGADYFTDFTRGDPFTKVPRGEIRLPGVGYERMNQLYSDEYGRYGLLDQYNILADVAPYSQQFKDLDQNIDMLMTEPYQKIQLQKIREKLENTSRKYEFSEYKYRGDSAEDLGPIMGGAARIGEMIAHSDNFLVQKFFGRNTAVEEWERNNVYGTSFPEWQSPIESYIDPMFNKATQRNPLAAMATLSVVGAAFGRTPQASFLGATVGAIAGAASSLFGIGYEAATGDRFIPLREKERLALEEYTDILSYVKSTRLANMAEVSGDAYSASQYRREAARTMYGADLEYGDVTSMVLAVPKRKREHFVSMLNAPVEDRERILSTSGRLERRMFQAAWGMRVEEKPDLVEYFSRHELPDASWEGWHPNTSMEAVKIKMGQSMGIEMSQMGYYPQQIRQANLVNPSYPEFGGGMGQQSTLATLRQLMSSSGLSGTVRPVYNSFGNNDIQLTAGIM